MENVFYIETLECEYENTIVFSAKNIEVPRGKLTVILGPSGSGKSTFIEALGLMNKTMTDDSKVFFNSQSSYDNKYITQYTNNKGINLNSLWAIPNRRNSQKAINVIRNTGFSFVFQETYLMPNFSAIENIALTDLIKGTSIQKSYHKIIRGLIKNLKLHNLTFRNEPSKYSGGERQRMAFGRGIFPGFEVLFGDEPTGNLDPHNAFEVMNYVKEYLHNSEKNSLKSAVIVTHSIDLALEFADRIIILTPKQHIEGKTMYTVLPQFIFNREEWEGNQNGGKKSDIRKEIDFLINAENTNCVIEYSVEIGSNNSESRQVIFNKYFSDCKRDETNIDNLISKVVCEIPDSSTRNDLKDIFKKQDKILFNCETKLNLNDSNKSISNKFNTGILKIFQALIKGEIDVLKSIWKNHHNLKSAFLNIFVFNELKEFLGRKFPKNLFFVLFIQFLIFYLIGTANGILSFVSKQGNSPFVKVINISANFNNVESKLKKVTDELDVKKYGIDSITFFSSASIPFNPVNEKPDIISQEEFYREDQDNSQLLTVRSLQFSDPLKDYILNAPILKPTGSVFSECDDYSVIITRNTLTRLGQKDSTFLYKRISDADSDKKYWQPIPVRGIVNQLPGDANIICLDNLYASFTKDNKWDLSSDQLIFWIKVDSTKIDALKSVLTKEVANIAQTKGIDIKTQNTYKELIGDSIYNVNFIKNLRNIENLYQISFNASGISNQTKALVYNELITSKKFVNYLQNYKIPLSHIQLSYINSLVSNIGLKYVNANLSVGDFKRIYEFSAEVDSIAKIKLDMANIERIKNYKIVESITVMLSSFLILFSILIITILLSNILSNHLNKIRKNIGLLMAFGVSTKVIYQCIMGTFIVVTLIGGLGLSYVVGDLMQLNKYIFESSTGFVLPDFTGFNLSWAYLSNSYSILKLITNPTLITVVLMLGFNLVRFNIIINKIFKETPGNLIYDKSNKG